MAAWRYGRELLDRRKKRLKQHAFTGAAIIIGVPTLALTVAYDEHRQRIGLLTTTGPGGVAVTLSGRDARGMRLVPTEGAWQLEVRRKGVPVVAVADEAIRVARHLLPWLNPAGSSAHGVELAVRQIEQAGSPAALFSAAAESLQHHGGGFLPVAGLIRRAPAELRLALEMAAHEDLELDAARGDLTELEVAWREAEEIGRIADELLTPRSVSDLLETLRRTGGRR